MVKEYYENYQYHLQKQLLRTFIHFYPPGLWLRG